VHSRRFVLNMHDKPTNQGEYQAPLSLSYPGDFPYAGEASSGSEYLVSGLPAGPLLVSLSLGDGPVSFEAWQADGDTIDCASSPGFPRCTLEASPSGGMRVRVNGPGHFELAIDPAPLLISDFTRDNGGVPIPNADPNGLSDELLVEGSPITSIEAVTVELFIRHGIPAELEAFLVAPDGTEVLVAGKDGGPYEGRYFQDYELESFSGWLRDAAFTVRPTEPLHALEGLDANGTWTLRVVDDENPNIQGNTGELYGWGLTFR
jgi:subtilisin-like proprotein convertase family protein